MFKHSLILLLAAPCAVSRAGERATPDHVSAPAPAVASHDVLTLREGQFHRNGKRFAEISFNKFDLLWTVWQAMDGARRRNSPEMEQAALAAQDKVLRDLHEMGFHTIRFFAAPPESLARIYGDPQAKQLWFHALDSVLDLCDRNQVQTVFCLGAAQMHDPAPAPGRPEASPHEGPLDLIGNPSSKSRQRLYAYLDEVVARYEGRKAVAMWDITNELTNSANIGQWRGERMPTLEQVAAFYEDVARRIKQNDPLRLVSNGGSHLREHAWNLHVGRGWKQRDTFEQHRQAFALLFGKSSVDVLDVHFYAVRQGGYEIVGPDGKPLFLTLAHYREIAASLGKGLFVGEYGALPSGWSDGGKKRAADPEWFEGYHDALAEKWVQKAVDDVVDAGVPLVHFWAYHSDRSMDQKPNPITFDKEKTPNLLRIIMEGNRRLKEKLKAQ